MMLARILFVLTCLVVVAACTSCTDQQIDSLHQQNHQIVGATTQPVVNYVQTGLDFTAKLSRLIDPILDLFRSSNFKPTTQPS